MTTDNLRIWSALEKTDPAHTKGFKRAGGFSGTAVKPMWVWQRLTELFGPFGEGWGCSKPEHTTVQAGVELLVFCTVSAWHGTKDNILWGVGGDKVIADTKNGPKSDDEAFKKAFTDALMNAFKFVGVGADVHMGRFDDNKYVQSMAEEFAPKPEVIDDHQRAHLMTLAEQAGADMKGFCQFFRITALPMLPVERFDQAKAMLEKKLAAKGPAANDLDTNIPFEDARNG